MSRSEVAAAFATTLLLVMAAAIAAILLVAMWRRYRRVRMLARLPPPNALSRALAEAADNKYLTAENRGHVLLMSILTPAQRREYALCRTVTVTGSDGKVYMVGCADRTYNISEGHHSYCVYPVGTQPVEDLMVGQILHLRHNAPHLRSKANRN